MACQSIFLFVSIKVVFIISCTDSQSSVSANENQSMAIGSCKQPKDIDEVDGGDINRARQQTCGYFCQNEYLFKFFNIIFFFDVPQILTAILFLKIKSGFDSISGVSKLGDLYMMSIFQRPTGEHGLTRVNTLATETDSERRKRQTKLESE